MGLNRYAVSLGQFDIPTAWDSRHLVYICMGVLEPLIFRNHNFKQTLHSKTSITEVLD